MQNNLASLVERSDCAANWLYKKISDSFIERRTCKLYRCSITGDNLSWKENIMWVLQIDQREEGAFKGGPGALTGAYMLGSITLRTYGAYSWAKEFP